ncbi:MAG: DUF1501 domain-containing protein [Roseivirga sp.]|nr:DUF1501 domain-containing protein [Roseivirga sp.]
MNNSRRSFLKQSSLLAAGSVLTPYFVSDFTQQFEAYTGKRLVIVQLSGGNDGLNTVVPYRNDLYYQKRPQLAIKSAEVLKLTDELGFNPVMGGMKSLFDEGLLSVINNVGYPNPDRSHFRSMDIWHTGSNANETWNTGWLGRYMDASCSGSGCESSHSVIELDDNLSLAMKGERVNGLAMSNPVSFLNRVRQARAKEIVKLNAGLSHGDDNLGYLYKTLIETDQSAEYISQKIKKYKTQTSYPDTGFAKDLKTIAELIGSGMETSVYYASMTGFDTHAGQKGKQERLLNTYSDAMKAFVDDLRSNSLLKDTMILTFSEFGRRVGQNASGGTDHGTANNLFVIGDSIKPGIFNESPNLTDLDKGDLKFDVDFRRIYATLLDKWLGVSSSITLNREFKTLDFI